MKRLLCIWLPNWPIQRLRSELLQAAGRSTDQARSGASADAPMVLWREDARRGRLVVACCRTASKLGVQVSMKLAEATDLLRSSAGYGSLRSGSPQGQPLIQRHDRNLDQRALEQIAASVQRQITPRVALEELGNKPWSGHPRHQCESLLCEIAGVSHLFGDEPGVLVAVREMLARRHLRVRMAVADSLAAAWALAHEADMKPLSLLTQEPASADSGISSVARQPGFSTSVFYGGLIVHGSQQTVGLIGDLPVQALRIGTDTVSTLVRLGVVSVRQVMALPRSGLATRLGRDLVQRLEQVQAEVDEPLGVHQPEAEYAVALELEYPTNDLEILMDRIKRLASKLASQLLMHQQGALRLSCCLRLVDGQRTSLDVGLFAPTVDAEHLSGLITNQLESKQIQDKVESLSLMVTLSGPLRSSQDSLFDLEQDRISAKGMAGVGIGRLVDALSGRMGCDRVGYLKLRNDSLPERAFDVLPLAGNAISPARKQQRKACGKRSGGGAHEFGAAISRPVVKPSAGDALRRPLSLLPEPAPLRVAWHETEFSLRVSSSRLPDRIRFSGVDHQILNQWGPERIESGWWRGKSVRRDYYRIETDQGEWWWIFRNLVTRDERQRNPTPYRWMLHGRFS